MQYLKYFLLICLFITLPLNAQTRWAFIIGITEYPQWQKTLPVLDSTFVDAQNLSTILTSEYGKFKTENVCLLTNEQATYQAVQQVLVQQLGQTKPEDFVLFVFFGHGVIEYDQMHLLLYDSDPNQISQTSLSLPRLADLLSVCIPAKRVFLCLDARHSQQSLGGSWKTNIGWTLELSSKELAILNSSAPYEIAKSQSGSSIFGYFIKHAFLGTPYLDKYPDADQDGILTVAEFGDYVSNTIRFSGLGQHPIFFGKSNAELADHIYEPMVQIISPTFLPDRGKPSAINFTFRIIFDRPLVNLQINGQDVALITITPKDRPPTFEHYVYHSQFTTNISAEQTSLTMTMQDEEEQSRTLTVPLIWRSRGWYGEWMPPGMTKASEIGVYLWQADQSEMIYIVEGPSLLGIPRESTEDLLNEIKDLQVCLKRLQTWYEQDYHFRRSLLQGLQETHDAIQPLVKQLNQIYIKTALFDEIQRRGANMPNDKTIDKTIAPLPPQIEPNALPKFREMLRQSRHDLANISQQNQEYQDILEYLELFIQTHQQILEESKAHTIFIPGFYIDRCEVTNTQYRKFCEQTARPNPIAPAWNVDYCFIDDYPVISVSWEDATAYSWWAKKNLPTAYQWEKSARTNQGFNYPWGNQEPNLALVNACVAPPVDIADTQTPRMWPLAVRSLPPGHSLCYHLAGNVHEWCQDLASLPNTESLLIGQEYRVTKGGSYASPGLLVSSWFMQPFHAFTRRSDLGFRCIVNP